MKPPKNLRKPIKHVNYTSLKQLHPGKEFFFRRRCPMCRRGLLMLRRDEYLKILQHDICINCGQRFLYDDIQQLWNRDGGKPLGL